MHATALGLVALVLICACGDDDGGAPASHPDASAAGSDAGVDGGGGSQPVPDAGGAGGATVMSDAGDASVELSCDQRNARFDAFVAAHQSCEIDADCTVIGDCGPNADFRPVRSDIAAEASRLMQERCTAAWDGPGYVARCEDQKCTLEEKHELCCGCDLSDAG